MKNTISGGEKVIKNPIIYCFIIIVCIIFVTGCISSQPAIENRTNNISVNVTTFTSSATPVQTQCPVPMRGCPLCPVWLTINPIADHHIGDIFEINGTIQRKNWTVENADKIQVEIECSSPGYRTIRPKEIIPIQHPSDCEVKTWSYQVHLSYHVPVEECIFSASTMERDRVSTRFNITPLNSDISVGSG